MVSSAAPNVARYIKELPEEQRKIVKAIRDLVRANLPPGYEECMQYGMISWIVPRAMLKETYNGQPLAVVSLAAQKNYISLYLMGVYMTPNGQDQLVAGFRAAGKKLDMGKSCLRIKSPGDLSLEAVAQALGAIGASELVEMYLKSRAKPSAPVKRLRKKLP